ncbi:PduL/EutD family phosphate acyltransferase [Salmonella sp. WGH-01]|nr:PduL/EutD family phosphate acyltransferase [Salmonella sp. WGH-01]
MDKELLQSTVRKVLDEMRQRPIPLGVSNRHIHLSAQDYERLFPGHPISEKSATAAGTICYGANRHPVGPKGQLKNVRLLGPLRSVSR